MLDAINHWIPYRKGLQVMHTHLGTYEIRVGPKRITLLLRWPKNHPKASPTPRRQFGSAFRTTRQAKIRVCEHLTECGTPAYMKSNDSGQVFFTTREYTQQEIDAI